jgi:hypothetical protein
VCTIPDLKFDYFASVAGDSDCDINLFYFFCQPLIRIKQATDFALHTSVSDLDLDSDPDLNSDQDPDSNPDFHLQLPGSRSAIVTG